MLVLQAMITVVLAACVIGAILFFALRPVGRQLAKRIEQWQQRDQRQQQEEEEMARLLEQARAELRYEVRSVSPEETQIVLKREKRS